MPKVLACYHCGPRRGCQMRFADGVTAYRIGRRLQSGHAPGEILRDHPGLSVDDLREAVERFLECPVARGADADPLAPPRRASPAAGQAREPEPLAARGIRRASAR